MTRSRASIASLAMACALACGVTTAEGQARPNGASPWRVGASALAASSMLAGPSISYDLWHTPRGRVALATSAMWSVSAIRPYFAACDDPRQYSRCSNGPAAARLLTLGGEASLVLSSGVYLVGGAAVAEGWWSRPVVGAQRSVQVTGGVGFALADGRHAIELRHLSVGSTDGPVNGFLLVWRVSR